MVTVKVGKKLEVEKIGVYFISHDEQWPRSQFTNGVRIEGKTWLREISEVELLLLDSVRLRNSRGETRWLMLPHEMTTWLGQP